jgi:hypothetical protein
VVVPTVAPPMPESRNLSGGVWSSSHPTLE